MGPLKLTLTIMNTQASETLGEWQLIIIRVNDKSLDRFVPADVNDGFDLARLLGASLGGLFLTSGLLYFGSHLGQLRSRSLRSGSFVAPIRSALGKQDQRWAVLIEISLKKRLSFRENSALPSSRLFAAC